MKKKFPFQLYISWSLANLFAIGIFPQWYGKCNTDQWGKAGSYVTSLYIKFLGFKVDFNTVRITGGWYVGEAIKEFWIFRSDYKEYIEHRLINFLYKTYFEKGKYGQIDSYNKKVIFEAFSYSIFSTFATRKERLALLLLVKFYKYNVFERGIPFIFGTYLH